MNIKIAALLLTGMLISIPAQCQLAEEFDRPQSNCCLAKKAGRLADQLLDWNQLGRYRAENLELKKQPSDNKRVLFMGDSITDGWRLAEYFPGKPYINRGISGQTAPQMLVRMYPDVIDLKPPAMVVLAGINDISQTSDILKLNAWMKNYASQVKAIYPDYFSALVDERGWLKEDCSVDGIHPNPEGYIIMAPIVEAAIQKALL
jgi:lysophospholipase L1-like esterase